ncbi:hypothetical protein D1007_48590 [Hordeum vulgare]|nr:hypothetical protein D1007_48590 [Hordeum vulgare]
MLSPVRLTGQAQRLSNQSGRAASPATPTDKPVVADANKMQPGGRWGDDGVNAYGDGQHRGSSSGGGGRGYAWQGNGGLGNGFAGPPGKSVLGVSGPPNPKRGGFKQDWGGRGGGRKPRPPLPPHEAATNKVDNPPPVANMGATKEAQKS